MTRPGWWIAGGLRIALGAVFVYAGGAKFGAEAAFADSIASFQLLPSVLINLVAVALPLFEILLGAQLIVGWRRRTAAFCAMLASLIFLLALVSAWLRGLSVDCGCFGPVTGFLSSKHPVWVSVGRDFTLLTAAVALYVTERSAAPQGPDPRGLVHKE